MRAILALCLVIICLREGSAQNVTVSTDKQSYRAGEKIKVSVTNGLSGSIYTAAASSTPTVAISNFERRFSQWSWDAYRLKGPGAGDDIDFDAPAGIAPGESVTFAWDPGIFVDGKYQKPMPGSWRFTLIYQVRKSNNTKDWIWRTTKSNEFSIE